MELGITGQQHHQEDDCLALKQITSPKKQIFTLLLLLLFI